MNQLIIVFEFKHETSDKVNSFQDLIRAYEMFAFVSKRACLIWTDHSPVAVRDFLKTQLSSGDKLYVGTTSSPSAWLTSVGQNVTDYIQKNLN